MSIETLQSDFTPLKNDLESGDIINRKALTQAKTTHESSSNFKGINIFLCQ